MSQKIVLFIVEGLTDKNSLAPALEEIVCNNKLNFQVVRGDIICDLDSNTENIERRLKNLVIKKFLDDNPQFKASDICEVIQICDTDGCFSDEAVVVHGEVDKTVYSEEGIICCDVDSFLNTKRNKCTNMRYLRTLSTIKLPYGLSVPYSLYYMSSSLEHVLHDEMNLSKDEKIKLSEKFSDEYDEPEKFVEFFNNPDIKVPGAYEETWDFIESDNNSLGRYSNFSVCIAKYYMM